MRALLAFIAALVVVSCSGSTGPQGPQGETGAQGTPELLGRWATEREPRRVLELNAGGKGTIDGMPLTWSVDGANLTISDPGGTDTTHWTVTGNRLVLTVGFGTELVFVRAQSSASPK